MAKATKRVGGRTISITHRGTTVIVKEGHDGTCAMQTGRHQEVSDKPFPQTARAALKWIMDGAGKIDESAYERGHTNDR